MKGRRFNWMKWQRGQALMEYWPTIPASVVIMLMASVVATFINDSILQTTEILEEPGDLDCEGESDEKDEGPEEAHLDCHTVQLVGKSYNEETDRTTVAYKVTSVCDPSISHWVLALPMSMQSKLLSASEQYEWGTDPTSGTTGIKFDTGYESDGGGGGGDEPKPPKPPKPPKKVRGHDLFFSLRPAPTTEDSRTVLLTLAGHYDWTMTTVTIKAGTQVFHSVITAPMAPYSGDGEDECEV